MRGTAYVVERQISWARRNRIELIANTRQRQPVGESAGQQYRTAYTTSLLANLFEPLSDECQCEFEAGDGGELAEKIQALYSSAALACNLFHHLRCIQRFDIVAETLAIGNRKVKSIRFEQQRPITDQPKSKGFSRNPNLDMILEHDPANTIRETAIECKMIEPYRDKTKGLKSAYIAAEYLWTKIPHCLQIAQAIGSEDCDEMFRHFHAAQIVKHILGLKHRNGIAGFELIYLFYDVPGEDGANHRREIEEFASVVSQDNVLFRAVTVQEFILNLLRHRSTCPAFVDYVSDRYL